MTPNPKQPTSQGIGALLKRAGFERAVMTNNSRHHKEHTEGFHTRKHPGGILVTWWAESRSPSMRTSAFVEAERKRQREMLARCAEAIEAAGWAVEVSTSMGHVIVSSKPEA